MNIILQVLFGALLGAAGLVVCFYLGLLLNGRPDWRTGAASLVILLAAQGISISIPLRCRPTSVCERNFVPHGSMGIALFQYPNVLGARNPGTVRSVCNNLALTSVFLGAPGHNSVGRFPGIPEDETPCREMTSRAS